MTASIWAPNGFSPEVVPFKSFEYSATASQTTFSIAPYTVLYDDQLKVFVGTSATKGEILRTTQYSIVGTDVVLNAGLVAGVYFRADVYVANPEGTPSDNPIPQPYPPGEVLSNDGTNLIWVPAAANTFIAAGVGAVVRTPQNKMRDVISVFDYLTEAQIEDVLSFGFTLDVTTGLQAALDAGATYFPYGGYLVTGMLNVLANRTLYGNGSLMYIESGTIINGAIFYSTFGNITYEGFQFDCAGDRSPPYASYPTVQNAAIAFDTGATNVKVINCFFGNLYTQFLNFYGTNGICVEFCKFTSEEQTQNTLLEFIWILTCMGRISINFCEFIPQEPASIGSGVCAVFVSGTTGSVDISKNYSEWCGRDNTGSHRLGVYDFYGNSDNLEVHDNIAVNCLAQFSRVAAIDHGKIRDNFLSWAPQAEVGGSCISVESTTTFIGTGNVGTNDVELSGNTLVGNNDNTRYGIVVASYDYGTPSRNVNVHHNNFENIGNTIQVSGPFEDVRVDDNHVRGAFGGTISQLYTGGGIVLTSVNGVTQAQSFYGDLFIRRNRMRDTGAFNRNAINCDMTKGGGAYTGTLGKFYIEDNDIDSVNANTSPGISVNAVALNNSAKVWLRGNSVAKFNISYYIRNCLGVIFSGPNTSIDHGSVAINESGNTKVTFGPMDQIKANLPIAGGNQSMTCMFVNPFFDLYGTGDPTVGPPVGVTAAGSCVKDTGITYPESPVAISAKVVSSGTSIANGISIAPGIQPWRGTDSVSVTVPLYSLSLANRAVVYGWDGTNYYFLGQQTVANTWELITGTFKPANGANWAVVVAIWDGVNYKNGGQVYVGGLNVVKGTRPALTLENSIARQSNVVIATTAPTLAPDFTGQRWYNNVTQKWYMAGGQSVVAEWILLN